MSEPRKLTPHEQDVLIMRYDVPSKLVKRLRCVTVQDGNFTVAIIKDPLSNYMRLGVAKRKPCDTLSRTAGDMIAIKRAITSKEKIPCTLST